MCLKVPLLLLSQPVGKRNLACRLSRKLLPLDDAIRVLEDEVKGVRPSKVKATRGESMQSDKERQRSLWAGGGRGLFRHDRSNPHSQAAMFRFSRDLAANLCLQ